MQALQRAETGDAEEEAPLAFDALPYRLVVIGEALPADLPARQPQVPWQEIARLRDLCVPKTSSMSCDQLILVDQATDASLSSDAVQAEIGRLG